MATHVAVTPSAGHEAERPWEEPRPGKSLLEAWLEYFKLLSVAAAIGAALLVGPIVTALAVAYAAYVLSRLFGG